ncbi:hypothetical protein [Glutamicibacter sp.]|uniref:hypothetical protein n=1 Tax=Glutamicibacter sp. TaxID=1931995 RepID=UPI003D6B459A
MTVGYLYLTRNTSNEILYVGQSSRLDSLSFQTYLGSGDLLRQAIEEIGAQNFHKEVLGYFDEQVSLDYAEILKIAELRNSGENLYNSGVGGPRAELAFKRTMLSRFGVIPQMAKEWLNAIAESPIEVKNILANLDVPEKDDFYRELETQLLVTQDLSRVCTRCKAEVGAVCRTKTGNPSRNHAKR